MSRPTHYGLGGNASTEIPRHLLFFDSESSERVVRKKPAERSLSLRLWVAISLELRGSRVVGRQVHRGHDAWEFWLLVEKMQKPRSVLWAFAHNLGHDLTQLRFWEELEAQKYTTGPIEATPTDPRVRGKRPWKGYMVLESMPCMAKVMGRFGAVRFVDTLNYWPRSAESIGEAHGKPKLPWPGFDAIDSTMFEYCTRDVEIVESAVLGLLRNWRADDCGVFKSTASGLALTNYQHRMEPFFAEHPNKRILINHDEDERIVAHQAVMGGRIETFRVGEYHQRFFRIDCNSLYPFVASKYMMPRKILRTGQGMAVDALRRMVLTCGVASEVGIKSPHSTYPIKKNGMQFHAKGVFRTCLCGQELWRAVHAGDVASVGRWASYSTDYIFKDWVEYWYRKKVAASKRGPKAAPERELAKMILNSLLGKFSQRGQRWEDRPEQIAAKTWGTWPVVDVDDGSCRIYRGVGNHTQELVDDVEPRHAFPAITAFVNSAAREYMRETIEKVGESHVYYMNTDSLILDEPGYRRAKKIGLIDDYELGLFKLEGSSESLVIRAGNYYRWAGEWVRSGHAGKARYQPDKGWRYESWQQLPSILQQKPDGTIRIVEHPLQDGTPFVKRQVMPDGTTRPYHISNDEDWTDILPIPTRNASVATAFDAYPERG